MWRLTKKKTGDKQMGGLWKQSSRFLKVKCFKKREAPKKKTGDEKLIQKWMNFFHNLKGYEKDRAL